MAFPLLQKKTVGPVNPYLGSMLALQEEMSEKMNSLAVIIMISLFFCVYVFQKLKHTESDKLQVQIQAYLDNVFDVGALLEDAETKNAALERVEELEENMSHVSALGD